MNIDHIIFAVPELESGMDEIESLLGVRPMIGGRHPKYGTHNALLSLGTDTYFEIIAPDPELPAPENGRLFDASGTGQSRLATWVLRSDSIEEQSAKVVSTGVPLGPLESGSRESPDGTVLSWRLTNPYATPFDGAIPFLIDWGNTPHPAGTTPRGCELVGLRIEHPKTDEVREALSVLGVDIDVNKADKYRLIATIRSVRGIVELK